MKYTIAVVFVIFGLAATAFAGTGSYVPAAYYTLNEHGVPSAVVPIRDHLRVRRQSSSSSSSSSSSTSGDGGAFYSETNSAHQTHPSGQQTGYVQTVQSVIPAAGDGINNRFGGSDTGTYHAQTAVLNTDGKVQYSTTSGKL